MSQEIACVCLQTADVMNLIQLLKNPQRPRGSDRRALFNRNLTKKKKKKEGCRIQICLCDVECPCLLRAWRKCARITGYACVGWGCPQISLCSGNMLIQPAIFLRGGHVPVFSHQPVSMELMGPCLCPPVYSMGDAVGSLERLRHLLLPGRRRPVQGETFFFGHLRTRRHICEPWILAATILLLYPRAWLLGVEERKIGDDVSKNWASPSSYTDLQNYKLLFDIHLWQRLTRNV